MSVPFVLDRTSGVPLYRQVYGLWRTAILSGRFRSGARVPSTRAFAEAYGLARITVTAAYEQLLAEGYFETRHGSGTFVSGELPDEALLPVRGPTGTSDGSSAGFGASSTSRIRGTPAVERVRLSRYASRLGEIQRLPAPARQLSLSSIAPDVSRFPFPLWRRLVSRHLQAGVPAVFARGADPAGHRPLREAIAAHLARWRAVTCAPEQVIVTSGSQQGLDLCARLLVDPGDEAAVEEPGYPGARQLFRAHGAVLRALRVTHTGASLDGLSKRTRVVHITPSHQFPTGVSMSLARRLELLDWARTRGAVVLEDDYDSEYRYGGPPLPAMHGLVDGANVIYLGTFSNVMFRGLRVGYLVVPNDLIGVVTTAKWVADRNTALLEQAALADFLAEGHLERHIRRMRRVYKRRREVLLEVLQRHFGGGVTVRGDAAGLHLTARFEAGLAVRAAAQRNGVVVADTGIYYMSKPVPDEFVLGFAAVSEHAIREGVRRLADRR